jgi:ornithine cyclodeaminase/alanine dehydrogenase-like protein (mu-crystallin family)
VSDVRMTQTLLLNRSEVRRLLDVPTLYSRLRDTFRVYSTERTIPGQHVGTPLPGDGRAASLNFPGLLPGVPAYTVKVHAKFPGSDPAIRGVLCLHDLSSGALLAIMDSTYLTALRTGLAGALAADVLARADASTIAIIGAGVQGEWQLRTIQLARPITRATIYDTEPGRAREFAGRLGEQLGIALIPCDSLAEALADADIIVTATWARAPFLHPGMIRPGTHITTLGPDGPGKCEVDAELIRVSTFIADDRDMALGIGALGGVRLGREALHAELGEVIADRAVGRRDAGDITIFGSVGLAVQDLAAGWLVYERAAAERPGVGFDFLA